jgi:hypothetical protein
MTDHDPDDDRRDEQPTDHLEPSPSTGWRSTYYVLNVPTPDAGGVDGWR